MSASATQGGHNKPEQEIDVKEQHIIRPISTEDPVQVVAAYERAVRKETSSDSTGNIRDICDTGEG